MAYAFETKQTSAAFRAHYARPVFDLLQDLTGLCDRIYARFSRFGLRLHDLKLETGDGSVGDVNLRCFLFGFRTTARIFLDRIEVNSAPPDGGSQKHFEVVEDIVELVSEHSSNVVIRTYESTMGAHGALSNVSVEEYLARLLATTPKNLGPLVGAGAAYYYGSMASQHAASLTIDLSQSVENGVFIQAKAIYDAQFMGVGALAGASRLFLNSAQKELDLAPADPAGG